jgi:hypothetical protein
MKVSLAFSSINYQTLDHRTYCVFRMVLNVRWEFFSHGGKAPGETGPPHYRGFTITLRYTTLGRTPLDEWSSRQRDLYLTTHNTHKRRTSMPPVGFEPAIPTSERPQTHTLDWAATGIGNSCILCTKLNYNPLKYSIKWYNPYRTLVSNSEYFTLTDATRCIVQYQYENRPVSILTKVSFVCRFFNISWLFVGKV